MARKVGKFSISGEVIRQSFEDKKMARLLHKIFARCIILEAKGRVVAEEEDGSPADVYDYIAVCADFDIAHPVDVPNYQWEIHSQTYNRKGQDIYKESIQCRRVFERTQSILTVTEV